LLAVADELFDVEVKAEILLSGTPGALSGPLRIAADNPIPLMPLLATYHDAHPAVRIEATFGNARDVLERLREYRADVALVSGAASDPTFTTKTLDTTPLMVVVPVTHAWSKRKTIALSSLDRRALIRRESGSLTQAALDRSCADANVVPTYPIEMSTREALREAIAQGLGIGVIARGEIGTDERLHAIRIRGIRGPGPLLDVSLACLTARRDVPVIRALFESSARARPRPAPA
jgi:DNA-binding transcriptional LysR family regulator